MLLSNSYYTNHIISRLKHDNRFKQLSRYELESIQCRDKEDADKIKSGIEYSINKNYISPIGKLPQYCPIIADNKTTEEICSDIQKQLKKTNGKKEPLILVGLSGTGKGTTAKALHQHIKQSLLWSNGNIFRIIYWQCLDRGITKNKYQQGKITDEDIDATILKILDKVSVQIVNEKIDIICTTHDGKNYHIHEIENSILKDPSVESMVEFLAGKTQGHVINFARKSVDTLSKKSMMILEGRKETLNFIPSNNRFELVIRDQSVLGMRRAAQKIADQIEDDILNIEDKKLEQIALEICEKLLDKYEKQYC